MSEKPFASYAYLGGKAEALEVLADGVYALIAEGDPERRRDRGRGPPRVLRARAAAP
jgi:hypothetical protein